MCKELCNQPMFSMHPEMLVWMSMIHATVCKKPHLFHNKQIFVVSPIQTNHRHWYNFSIFHSYRPCSLPPKVRKPNYITQFWPKAAITSIATLCLSATLSCVDFANVGDHLKIEWCQMRRNYFVWGRGLALISFPFRLLLYLWHHSFKEKHWLTSMEL